MTNNIPDYEDNLYFDSQNTKNEQQKDLCITSEQLTEQCKKGELPVGKYYIECKDGSVTTMYLGNDDYSVRNIKSKGFKIIAPVPTFDEWKASYNCMLENEVLRLKNAQLKELLKECLEPLEVDAGKKNACEWNPEDLLAKIDEVLK